jgi:cation diffusion facilitator family transporter
MKINQASKSSVLSILSNLFLIVFKLIIGFSTNSVSVISDGIHSFIDLISSLGTFITLLLSSKPPDKNHNYGHQKIEDVGSLIQFLLIFGTGTLIIIIAINKIVNPVISITHLGFAIGVMFVSSIINLTVSLHLKEMSKQYSSVALLAESKHRLSDFFSSFGICIGLILVWIFSIPILDQIISIGVGLLICYESLGILKQALNSLLDTSLPEDELSEIIDILNKYKDNYNNYYDLKTRKSGNKRYIEMKIIVDSKLTMSQVSILCKSIEKDINKILKDTDVVIQIESDCNNKVSCGLNKNKLKMKIIYKNF